MPPTTQAPLVERFFLGVERTLGADWERYYAEPQATRASKEASVEKEISKKREKQLAKADRFAFGGFVSALHVVNLAGNDIVSLTARTLQEAEQLARNFVAFVTANHDPLGLTPYPDAYDCRVKWFGFDIREVMHQLAMTAYGAPGPAVYVPPGMWYHRNFEPAPFLDPYDALVPTAVRDDVDFYALVERLFGNHLTAADVATAKQRAVWARELVLRSQLCYLPQ